MNLLPLINKIHATNIGTKGKNLFVNMMPSEIDNAILLRTPLGGTRIDYYLPGYLKAEFQVIVRSVGYDTGLAVLKQLTDFLTFGELQIETQYFNYCRPRSTPSVYPLSKGNLIEYNVLFDCCFTEA